MELLITVLLLIVCLLISNVISHYIPSIPTALTQIAFGIIVALAFKGISIGLESEWFLLLFVAPLLYNDGRHFPREELWKMKVPIFGNAVFLVILTTIGGGYFIHWMIPSIPLAAAFALAAILSPTDPVAVNGITKRVHIPEKVLNLVKGESLINDASGLIGFKYAVAAVVTGYFSLRTALLDFSYMFIIGAILGVVLGLFVTWIRHTLHKQGITDVTFYSMLSLLTPFIIYIVTEEFFHASGVISVVVAGIIHSLVAERIETAVAEEKLLTENMWSVITFALNGIVFLLLGLIIPSSMAATVANPNIGNLLAIGYVFAIGIVIMGIRFVWTSISSIYQYYVRKKEEADKPGFKISLLTSLTGVRGAVTMAGVLSLPHFTLNGEDFPNRSLILFIAAGTVLLTLIIATIFIPMLSRNNAKETQVVNKMDLSEAKRKIILTAIKGFRQEMNKENEAVAYELIDEYKFMFSRIYSEQDLEEADNYLQKITEVRLIGLKAERRYIQDLLEKNQINQNEYEIFEKALNHKEEALLNSIRADIKYILGKTFRNWRYLTRFYRKSNGTNSDKLHLGKYVQFKAFQAAIKSIEEYGKDYGDESIIKTVVFDYNKMIKRLKATTLQYNEKREEQKEELRIKIIDKERSEIYRMYESGEINLDLVKELRRFVNYTETIALYEYH